MHTKCPTCRAPVYKSYNEYGSVYKFEGTDNGFIGELIEGELGAVSVPIQKLSNFIGLPQYQTEGSVGMDLLAAIDDAIYLAPHSHDTVPTGIAVKIPEGFEGQIRPRSGLAAKHGITVLNSPGTIDSDYVKEIKVILHNDSNEATYVEPKQRIAQLLVEPVTKVKWNVVDILDETGRGGFGSTGNYG